MMRMEFAKLAMPELADMLSVPVGTIKSRTFVALKGLQKALDDAGFGGGDQWTTTSTS